MNFLELITVEKIMMKTMKLVEYRRLSVSLKKKNKNKRIRRRNKKNKGSINKSECREQ